MVRFNAELAEVRVLYGPREEDVLRALWDHRKALNDYVLPPEKTPKSDVDAVFGSPSGFVPQQAESAGPWSPMCGLEPPYYNYKLRSVELRVSYVDDLVKQSELSGMIQNGLGRPDDRLEDIWYLRRVLVELDEPLRQASWNKRFREAGSK
jgi:hypothetical protein